VSQARILAVDDQLYFRVFLEDLLREEGYEVATAAGGEEALAILDERGPFELILTDLVMPGMDGSELVQRVKQRDALQDVVVVTSVGDVKTAVDAMKLGATDYLLKPIDRQALLRTLENILQRRRLSEEHARLMAENLEYMGVFTQYERALGFFSTLSLEPLADRIVEGLCLETNAQGGVLWLARPDAMQSLRLLGAGGLVRAAEEPDELDAEALPERLRALREEDTRSLLLASDADPERKELFLALRTGRRLLGILRLTDKIDGSAFDTADREVGERLASFAGQAVANATQFQALERRSFKDPTTQAYTRAYFEDVVRNEIHKARRFARSFSLVRVALDPIGSVRAHMLPPDFTRWIQDVTAELGKVLRTTDLLAAESDSEFCMLLPETDALGAAVAKRRLRAALERSDAIRGLDASERPSVLAGAVSFPADGGHLEALVETLERRIEEDRRSLLRAYELESAPFRGLSEALLAEAPAGRPETAEQMARFLLGEVGRRAHERGLLFLAPGGSQLGALRDSLEALRGTRPRTEVVLVADREDDWLPGVPVTWVSPVRAGTPNPFIVYFGEGPPYALVREATGPGEEMALYHTSDPVLVEQLAFQLGRDLGIPIGE